MPLTRARACALIVLAAGLVLGPAAAYGRAVPADFWAKRYAVGSAGMSAAMAIGRTYWGSDACGGSVTLAWAPTDPPSINARSYWTNPVAAFGAPAQNQNCAIVFNSNASLPWPRFCTVVVHELGHLHGFPHSADPDAVMAAVLQTPLPACAAVPDPAGPLRRTG
jgi:hypothetical protein